MNDREQNSHGENVIDARELFKARAANAWLTKVGIDGLSTIVHLPRPHVPIPFPQPNERRDVKPSSDAERDKQIIRLAVGYVMNAMKNAGFEVEALELEQQCIQEIHDGADTLAVLRRIAADKLKSVSPKMYARILKDRPELLDNQ